MRTIRSRLLVLPRLALSVLLLGAAAPASAVTQEEAARALEAMTWYTEEYPPYNYADDNGVPVGMCVEILMAAFERLGVGLRPADLQIVPWNRSYKYVQSRPGTALFVMTYTPERGKLVKFVGPAVALANSVIAPKARKIVVHSAKDLNLYTIGVVQNDIGDQLVRELGLRPDGIRRINNAEQLHALLRAGKVDVVAYAVDVFNHAIRKAADDTQRYEAVYKLNEGQGGYAFHKATDPEVLAHLQRVIDELKADGTVDRIVAAYSN